jgi:DNA polymerase-3 subunit alpha
VSLFADAYEQYRECVVKDAILVVEGDVSLDDFSGGLKMVARKVFNLAQARSNYARLIELQLQQSQVSQEFGQQLRSLLEAYAQGECRVRIQYTLPDAQARFYLSDAWKIRPAPELISQLQGLCGEKNLRVLYR